MLYLARLGKKQYAKKMVRQAERARDVGQQALGILGGAQAKKYLKAQKKKRGDGPAYLGLDIALFNTGSAGSWKKVQKTLDKRPGKNLGKLAFLRGNKSASRTVVRYLKKNARKWKKSDEDLYALSVAVRAQLGDKERSKKSRSFWIVLRKTFERPLYAGLVVIGGMCGAT